MKLSIIIPAYNEQNTISEIISRVKEQKVFNLDKEIIVVDDGSTDNSNDILKEIKGIKLLTHKKNRGKGAAIRTGLENVTGDYVLIQDADLELSPSDYPTLLKPALEKNAKVVYGSRLIGGVNPDHNFFFYAGGRLVTFVANLLYGIHITDEPIGYKLFKTEIIKSLNLKCEGFEFCPEVTAKIAKRKIRIHEVPVKYTPRKIEEGKKLRFTDGIEAIWVLLKNRFN